MRTNIYVLIALFLMTSVQFIPMIEGKIRKSEIQEDVNEVVFEIHTLNGIERINRLVSKEEVVALISILNDTMETLVLPEVNDVAILREKVIETLTPIQETIVTLKEKGLFPDVTVTRENLLIENKNNDMFNFQTFYERDSINLCCFILASGSGIPYSPLSILLELIHSQLWSTLYQYPLLDFLMTCLSCVLFACKIRPRVCYPIVFWFAQEMRVYTLGVKGYNTRRIESSFPYSIKIFGIAGFLGLSITIFASNSGNPFCWMAGTAFEVWS